MITVTEICYLRGYSHDDHLLDDDELSEMLGEDFKNMADAKDRADELRGEGTALTVPIRIKAETQRGTSVSVVVR